MNASKVRVGVVRGGTSGEYDVSLKTGSTIIKNLPPSKYRVRDILITRDGKWHLDGIEKTPESILKHVDVIFNGLHGSFGEDGKIQQFLDAHGAKYTGSGALGSALAMNKVLTKKHALKEKIKTAVHAVVRKEELLVEALSEKIAEKARHLFKTFPQPSVIKPATSGSSLGVSIVRTIAEMEKALHEAFQHSDTVIVEEFVDGREATCGVIDDFRGEKHYALPPVEIRKPAKSTFFDFKAKYGSGEAAAEEICPGNFTAQEKAEIQRMAKQIHQALGLKHYSRSDFIVHPRRGIYFLEVNTLPGMTEGSLFPKSLEAVGAGLPDFLDHLLALAQRSR